MPTKGKHVQGGKFTGHTTVTDTAYKVVTQVAKYPEVTKISPGIVKSGLHGGYRGLKVKPMNGGWLVTVRGAIDVQELRVYTGNPKATAGRLNKIKL